MSTEAAARAFFAKPHFAVVGASTNKAKFGYKIFAWYVYHNLPVTPVNPGSAAIAVDGAGASAKDHATVPNLSALPNPRDTALSVVTPPAVTLGVLREAQQLGIGAVWLQPGTYDESVLAFARGTAGGGFETVVAGDGGCGGEGWCVLVDGERALQANGKL